MGMTCWLLEVTPVQITALRTAPELTDQLAMTVQEGDMDRRLAENLKGLPPEQREKLEKQLREAKSSLPGYEAEMAQRVRLAALGSIAEPLYLEKSWHVLHYLFTGHADDAEAPGNALLSGEPIGGDVGYGPPRLHSPQETRAFAEFLSRQDVARLQSRVNLAEMARLQIYPVFADAGADEAAAWREDVAVTVPQLTAYVTRAAAHGSGLLIWLS